MDRMVGLRGVPASAHPLAVLKDLSPVDCCQGRWCLPLCWAPPGRLSSSAVSWQIGSSQHEPSVHLFSDVYRLQIALKTWSNPSRGLFDFICVVFIRWPGSLFPSHSSDLLCGTVVRQLRQTKTLAAMLLTGPVPQIHLFYFPQQCSQTSMFPFPHSEWISATPPLFGMGRQCCISTDNLALTLPCRAQPSSSVNLMVRFSMCGTNLILLQPPQLINVPTLIIADARPCGERYCLIRHVWNKIKGYCSLLCLATVTILFRI